MPIIQITPALAATIKSERKSRNIRGDVISTSLGKTNTFISQIETGKISEIDIKLFYEIFKQIIDKDLYDSYMSELANKKDLFITKYSEDEIEAEKNFITFQERFCLIPIPSQIIYYIQQQLQGLNITGKQLIDEINKNKTLNNPESYKNNNYTVNIDKDTNKINSIIKFNLDELLIDEIISGKKKSIYYIYMLGIVFNILMLNGKNEYDSNIIAHKMLDEADFILPYRREVKFQQNISQSKIKPKNLYDFYENEHYAEYGEFIKKINMIYNISKDKDILITNEALKQHIINMKADRDFTMALLSAPLSKISDDKKAEFFKEYRKLLSKYCSNDLDTKE